MTCHRPHNKGADFIEPIVWLLGLAPPHAVREWMQHEGLVVEAGGTRVTRVTRYMR